MPLPVFDPATYDAQLAEKLARFRADFAPLDLPEPEVFTSEPLHYRMRAEFRLWHHDGRVDYAMFDAENPRKPVLLDDFPPAARPIADAMPRLRDALDASDELRRRIFQVEFLATLSGELLVTLVYHRRLGPEWEAAARELAAALGAQIIGRSRGQKIVLERDWLLEEFELDGRRLRYQQIEGSFTQPNGGVNRKMLGWARARAAGAGGDLLELYCGNGNFTLPLATRVNRVLATEISKSSVNAALANLADNGIDNVILVRLSAEELTQALNKVRPFRRLADVDLDSYRFGTVFVDPPRAGMDPDTCELTRRFDRILYISCNPATLAENIRQLSDTHRITRCALFDQFPWTHHMEAGVLLERR